MLLVVCSYGLIGVGMTLLEEVCHWETGVSLDVLKAHVRCRLSLCRWLRV